MADRGTDEGTRIGAADLEESFSRLTGESDENPAPIQRPGVVVGAVAASALLVAAFLLGRRLGRKKSTFVEIVRV
ncbi:MAG: hypothetical protein CL458_00955 [Acidimicrobiaceae bacterium]|nr:hypothetical protein [Acidimicrobiaceae bacterium]|tara:strand:+ start:26801 stop:27025 length:225 start_codon:yes stop_codon:yes gene_type:complete